MFSGKIIALDIGGVCIELHFEAMLKRLGVNALNFIPPAGFKKICDDFERGLVTRSVWLDFFMEYTQGKYSRAELVSIWNSVIGGAKTGMADAVRSKIDRGFRFIYFSNTSSLHMDAFFSTNSFSHLVTGGVYSYETGLMKPAPEMYAAFERRYGKPYAYFDDRRENVEAALARSWNAVLFRSCEDLENLK